MIYLQLLHNPLQYKQQLSKTRKMATLTSVLGFTTTSPNSGFWSIPEPRSRVWPPPQTTVSILTSSSKQSTGPRCHAMVKECCRSESGVRHIIKMSWSLTRQKQYSGWILSRNTESICSGINGATTTYMILSLT